MSPEHSNFGAATDVPHDHFDFVEGDAFDVEADGRDGGDFFVEFELVEDCGLANGVEAEEDGAYFLFGEELEEELGEVLTHLEYILMI